MCVSADFEHCPCTIVCLFVCVCVCVSHRYMWPLYKIKLVCLNTKNNIAKQNHLTIKAKMNMVVFLQGSTIIIKVCDFLEMLS